MLCPHPTLSHLPQIPSPFPDFYAAAWRVDDNLPPLPPGVALLAAWDCEPLLFTTLAEDGTLYLAVAVDGHDGDEQRGRFTTYVAAPVPPAWGKETVSTRAILEDAERAFVVGYEPLQPGECPTKSPLRYWEVRGKDVPNEWLSDEDAIVTAELRIGVARTTADMVCR